MKRKGKAITTNRIKEMFKEITIHDSRRVYSDKHFTLITVNKTTQTFERSTL